MIDWAYQTVTVSPFDTSGNPDYCHGRTSSDIDVCLAMSVERGARGLMVNAITPHPDGPGSNPGRVRGYALLMSSNESETRVQCFPFEVDCLSKVTLIWLDEIRSCSVLKLKSVTSETPKILYKGRVQRQITTALGPMFRQTQSRL